MKWDEVIHEYAQSYESRDPDYTPTDHERALIEDAINRFLHGYLKQRYTGRSGMAPQAATLETERDTQNPNRRVLFMVSCAETEPRSRQPEEGSE